MRWLMSRRSVSSCVSPGPRMPMPPRNFSRWVHMRVRRGSMYSQLRELHLHLRLVGARARARRCRGSAPRGPSRACRRAFSMFLPCAGESSSSKMTSDAFELARAARSSSTLPLPRYVPGCGRSSCCVSVADDLARRPCRPGARAPRGARRRGGGASQRFERRAHEERALDGRRRGRSGRELMVDPPSGDDVNGARWSVRRRRDTDAGRAVASACRRAPRSGRCGRTDA